MKLLTPKDAELSDGAKLSAPGKELIQSSIFFDRIGAKAVFNTRLPAGKYQIWNLNRFESHITPNHAAHTKRDLAMKLADYSNGIASTGNTCANFYKAQFGKPGERSHFKWDFPLTKKTTYPYHRPDTITTKGSNKLEVVMERTCKGGAELSAILIVPCDDPEFVTAMIKILCGLNNEQWKINKEIELFFKK